MDEEFLRGQLRYYFARYCYVHRHERTPIRGITWAERFEQVWKMTLTDYIKLAQAEDHKGTYEICSASKTQSET